MPRKNRFASNSNNLLLAFGIIVVVIIYFVNKNSGSGQSAKSLIDKSPAGLGQDLSVNISGFANIRKSRFGNSSPSSQDFENKTLTVYADGTPVSKSLESEAITVPKEYYPGVLFDNKSYQVLFMIMNWNLRKNMKSINKIVSIPTLYDKVGINTGNFESISKNIKNLSKDEYNVLSYGLLCNIYMLNKYLKGFIDYGKKIENINDKSMSGVFSIIKYLMNYDPWNNIDSTGNGWKNYELGNSFTNQITLSGSRDNNNLTPVSGIKNKRVKNIILVYNGKVDNKNSLCDIIININGKDYSTPVAWFDNPTSFNINLYIPPLDYIQGFRINSFNISVNCTSGKAILENAVLTFIYFN